jgi:hypothetical protein
MSPHHSWSVLSFDELELATCICHCADLRLQDTDFERELKSCIYQSHFMITDASPNAATNP